MYKNNFEIHSRFQPLFRCLTYFSTPQVIVIRYLIYYYKYLLYGYSDEVSDEKNNIIYVRSYNDDLGINDFFDFIQNTPDISRNFLVARLSQAYIQDIIKECIIEKGMSSLFNYHITCDAVTHPGIDVNQIEEIIIGFTSKLNGVKELIIIDPFIYTEDEKCISLFMKMVSSLSQELKTITIFSNKNVSLKKDPIHAALLEKLPHVSVKNVVTDFFHDRFWLDPSNQKGIVIGTSLNGIGKKLALIDNINRNDVITIASQANEIEETMNSKKI